MHLNRIKGICLRCFIKSYYVYNNKKNKTDRGAIFLYKSGPIGKITTMRVVSPRDN